MHGLLQSRVKQRANLIVIPLIFVPTAKLNAAMVRQHRVIIAAAAIAQMGAMLVVVVSAVRGRH